MDKIARENLQDRYEEVNEQLWDLADGSNPELQAELEVEFDQLKEHIDALDSVELVIE